MKRISKLLACVGLVSLLLSSGIFALFPTNASAAVTGNVIDRATIKVGDRVFIDGDIDDNFSYEEESPSDKCADTIEGFNNDNLRPGNTPRTATIIINTPAGPGSSACNEKEDTINFTNRDNFLKSFAWIDSGTIRGADGKLTFNKNRSSNVFVGTKESGGCYDTLTVNGGNQTATLIVRQGGSKDSKAISKDDYDWYPFERPSNRESEWKWNGTMECWESPPVRNVRLSGNPKDGSSGAAARAAADDAIGATNGGSCESIGGILSWILCPVIELLDSASNALDNAIQAQLATPETDTDTEANAQLKEAWGRLRNIALIVLVPIMLVMVIGTALGFQGLDAYTVKRAMPRLLIAVIFISLSWYLTAFLIRFTNVVGAGVYGLITNPFGLASRSLSDMITAGSGGALSYLTIFGGLLAVGVGAVSIGIVLSLAFSAALALFLGFCILVLRNVFIFAMVLLAPLAILAWIFPNNDRLWKLWWGTFSKLLLMYPMIMALIAAGKIFAYIIPIQRGGGSGLFTNAAIIIAYISPYFFIPATFKFAGGAFANIAGIINDRGRGLFDRQKKYRQEERARKMHEAAIGNRFRGGNPNNIRGRLNERIAQGVAIGSGKAGIAFWKDGRVSTVHGAHTLEEIEKNEKENRDYATWASNDDLNKFASASDDEASLRRIMTDSGFYRGREGQMEQDVARVERVRRQMSTDAFRQMTMLHAVAGGTTYDTDDSHNGVEWIEAAARAAGNDDAALANLIAKGKSAAMAAGRADQGVVSFGTAFSAARNIRDSFSGTPEQQARVREQAGHSVHGNVLDSAGAGILAHSSMKPNTLRRLLPEMRHRLTAAYQQSQATGDPSAYQRQLAQFANLYDQMSGSSPQNAAILADGILAYRPDGRNAAAMQAGAAGTLGPVQAGAVGPTVQEDLDRVRSSDAFRLLRREYAAERNALSPEEAARLANQVGPNDPNTPGGAPLTPS